MNLPSIVILMAAAFFLLYGLAFTIFPGGMSLLVTGSEPESTSALVDFRAAYGGMTLAVGAALVYLQVNRQFGSGLVIVILVLLGMAIARILGLLLDGAGNFLMYLYLALELAGSALAFFALWRIREEA